MDTLVGQQLAGKYMIQSEIARRGMGIEVSFWPEETALCQNKQTAQATPCAL